MINATQDNPHLVLFDVDGTLLDSFDFDTALFLQAVQEVTDKTISGDWNAYMHATDSGLLQEAFPQAGPELEQSVKKVFTAATRSYLMALPGGLEGATLAIPGAADFVRLLVDQPYCAVGIATGGWRETALLKLRHIGLGPLLDAGNLPLATASEHHDRQVIMQLAAEQALAGRTPISHTYFGDGQWDKRTCAALGWSFVAIGERVAHQPRFSDFRQAEAIMKAAGIVPA
jgi:FMN phosphatase YigB (HAD superfamily)